MKKILFAILILIILLANISAIRINEIESNPSGQDSGNEWIELYSKDEVNLIDYKLVNNDGDELWLSGSFSKYYIYTFDKQWLDNTDEKIFLYKGKDLIDETDLVDDGENNDKTWQFCDGDWEFVESTEEEKNECEDEKEENEETKQEENLNEIETTNTEVEESTTEQTKPEVISLNPKDIKSEENKKKLGEIDYPLYGFIGFCFLLGILFIIRKRVFNKNEFK